MDNAEYQALADILETAARSLRRLGNPSTVPVPVDAVPAAGRLVLSIKETAEELGVSRNSVYTLIASGKIPSLRIGTRRLVARAALVEWLSRQSAGS